MTEDEARAALRTAGADKVKFHTTESGSLCVGIEWQGKRNVVLYNEPARLSSAVGILKGWMFREREKDAA